MSNGQVPTEMGEISVRGRSVGDFLERVEGWLRGEGGVVGKAASALDADATLALDEIRNALGAAHTAIASLEARVADLETIIGAGQAGGKPEETTAGNGEPSSDTGQVVDSAGGTVPAGETK